ncbi:bifunctional phosphopantothenoylcysteine decarboxylase/phosphopantothenate--cysteine ligase CoaBC [Crocinitomicaceae bacterium CZZ-1]|uniref:Coenzyme A biosynthesis bifunctional protein CoaBC n=1 Tax=Taishania pollutisoli TaxID=2766479 RepID=A0A8J6P743_9FLAO|nr:bifunctional phosphopantothenoylcysteine decarboxylase/phosphopantothenate--cysteine ligase CoaBC [Taishania pollutisoli]MBC9813234.1 bifunctional phosphopantothenoylcysteine decarboxylase/phosphopantothenate--cysteine ligase CoaBC [Taishania pollutisoli]
MLNKRILLGITGGIAAYKIAFLIRLLKKEGAEVRCIMTPASCDFISPLVVATLSENPVGIEFWNKADGSWVNHVEYGLWADVFVIAPATANSLAKMATGSCDNLLLATYLSNKSKTMIAPAMDLDMYAHPTTKRNLEQLQADGVKIIPAESGFLASGLQGEGRMAEPETILRHIQTEFLSSEELKGKKILVTAGPTYESIDPVRYIGNHSSGKMGYDIAEALAYKGAEVLLISGPSSLSVHHPSIRLERIVTAQQLLQAVQSNWNQMDGGIFSAAVADYRPKDIASEKIKKSEEELTLQLIKNPDVLKWAGEHKHPDQLLVGFALETNNILENGKAKLERKNLDFIVINQPETGKTGFGADTNKITLLDNHNNLTKFELKSKKQVANDIVEYYINYKK